MMPYLLSRMSAWLKPCRNSAEQNARLQPLGSTRGRQRANGYALIALMILVTVMLISITEALPRILHQLQREREQETIFRGEQYARAIYLFHRTVGRYPNSIKELLNTNGTRYLRQAYTDPLSPNARWHFIHASASGIILDSQNQTASSIRQPGGSPSAFGPGMQGMGNTSLGYGSAQPGATTSGFSSSSTMNTSPSGFGSTAATGEGFSTAQESTTGGNKKGPPAPPPDCRSAESSDSTSPAQTGQLLGATIVGVAPCNIHASIRVLDKKDHYYQWEFMGMNYLPYTLPKVQTVQPSSSFPNAQPGQPMGSPMNSGPPATQPISPQPSQNQNPN